MLGLRSSPGAARMVTLPYIINGLLGDGSLRRTFILPLPDPLC